MAVPKFRTSASKRNMRRSHHALKPMSLSSCPNCKEPKINHTVCLKCGFYRGEQRVATSGDADVPANEKTPETPASS